jgi:hypothetical protein
MSSELHKHLARWLIGGMAVLWPPRTAPGQEPPALNPFGTRAEQPHRRDDAVPGYLELSNGRIRPGQLSLTRDARLKIFDEARKQHREVPLKAIRRIDCTVLKQWVEPEWRFRENASDEKVLTGRTYPAREYTHEIALLNGQTIRGPLSGIIYVQADPTQEPDRYLLHKRDKGEPGTDLRSLVYVRSIQLGEKALEEGRRKAAGRTTDSGGAKGPASRKGRR